MEHSDLKLPQLIITPGDVRRLIRELESLDDYLNQAALRHGGESQAKLPRVSRLLDELADDNKLNLLYPASRKAARNFLEDLNKNAPVIHFSFQNDPSSAFLVKVTSWLRQNISERILISVGLEPTLAAGCVIRTPNHFIDLSLRKEFDAQRPLLISKIKGDS